MFEIFLRPESWAAIATLTALEVVLGIDNLVFIAVIAGRLPADRQEAARKIGLTVALVARLVLLLALSWLIGLNRPLFTVFGISMSGKSLILLGGGLFLLVKATREIYAKTELAHEEHFGVKAAVSAFGVVVFQIVLVDIVFSVDSLITAIGLVHDITLITVAIIISIAVMFFSSGAVSKFINAHPSLKILALAFLLLIGVLLVAEGTGQKFDKGYVYFAMAFSLLVEMLDMRRQRNLVQKGLLSSEAAG